MQTIKNRIKVFNENTLSVLSYYGRLGKVHHVDGSGNIESSYKSVQKAIKPKLIFFYGMPCTGKSEAAKFLC